MPGINRYYKILQVGMHRAGLKSIRQIQYTPSKNTIPRLAHLFTNFCAYVYYDVLYTYIANLNDIYIYI